MSMLNRNRDFKKIVLFCVIMVAFFSCKKNVIEFDSNDDNVQYVDYHPDQVKNAMRDSVFNNTWFVKLETNSRNLIGNIDKLLFVDNNIVVVDKYIAKAIYLFDMNGHFERQISRLGNGPIEYLAIHNVFLTPDNNIAIVDNMKSRIMYFDKKGRFLRADKMSIRGSEVEMINEDNIVANIYSGMYYEYSSLNDKSFVVLDKKGNPKYSFAKSLYNSTFHVTRMKNLYKFGDEVFCNVNFKNTIYKIAEDGVYAKYKIRFWEDNLEEPIFNNSDEFRNFIELNYFFNGKFVELNDYSYFAFIDPKYGELKLIYDHNTHKCTSISNDSYNPILSFFTSPIDRYSENTLVESIPLSRIMFFKDTFMKEFGDNAAVVDLYDNLDLDSNPVLFFYNVCINN